MSADLVAPQPDIGEQIVVQCRQLLDGAMALPMSLGGGARSCQLRP